MKDYLGYENDRNHRHAAVYERFLRRALDKPEVAVLIGHHITFEFDCDGDGKLDIATMNEVPSADCLLFDHELMGKVFGKHALTIMATLSQVSCEERDELFAGYLDALETQGVEALEGA